MRALGFALLLAAPASAELTEAAPDHFVSRSEAVVTLPPDRVWAALIDWPAWWDKAHTYSGSAAALHLEPRSGGPLQERWAGGSTLHATVLTAMPPRLLRLSGGFGPLQSLPVTAVVDFALRPEGAGTKVTMIYRVSGAPAWKLDTLAAPVDAVMSAGFARLVRFATTGKPEGSD